MQQVYDCIMQQAEIDLALSWPLTLARQAGLERTCPALQLWTYWLAWPPR